MAAKGKNRRDEKKRKRDAKKRKREHEKRKKRGGQTAATADRHDLYQRSVQNPEHEVEFLSDLFEELRGRPAVTVREDFAGTGWFSRHWVASHPARRALAVDLDAEVLAWGREHNVAALGEDGARLRLLEADVREADGGPHDLVVAFNYSYFTFRTRDALRGYFAAVRRALADDGLFVLDIFGGPEAQTALEEEREDEGFSYVWDQDEYDPITGTARNYIHFRFPDGSEMHRAFSYEWRLWSLVEVREVLQEAGFDVDVWWEEADEDGEGSGEFRRQESVENELCWNAYVVARPRA